MTGRCSLIGRARVKTAIAFGFSFRLYYFQLKKKVILFLTHFKTQTTVFYSKELSPRVFNSKIGGDLSGNG